MANIERFTGRKYQLVKVFVAGGGEFQEAKTGRRYNLVKKYV